MGCSAPGRRLPNNSPFGAALIRGLGLNGPSGGVIRSRRSGRHWIGSQPGATRPGGNLTGISDVSAEVTPKRLELLKEIAPGLRRVAMLWNAADLGMTLRYRASEAGAKAMGVGVQQLGVREPDDFDRAFAAMNRDTLSELHRDMERRRLVRDQIRQIESARLDHLKHEPGEGAHAMVRLLARVMSADMLVQEVLSRNLRDRRAVARYAGLTGSPDESGKKRREKGLARSGNPRVRRGMIQLAWRFLMFQKDSALAQWFRARTENVRGTRKTMIVALARKLLIALWRLVRDGVVPDGVILRPAQ